MHQRILIERIRKGDHHRNHQHDHASPLEQQSAQVFQRVIGAEHVDENLVNNLEAENRVACLAQPEERESHGVSAGEQKRKDDGKIHILRYEEREKHGKLLVQLTA